jgi:hypothetical protein
MKLINTMHNIIKDKIDYKYKNKKNSKENNKHNNKDNSVNKKNKKYRIIKMLIMPRDLAIPVLLGG